MSIFNNPRYVQEFAYRTMLNYYKGIKTFGKTEEQEEACKQIYLIENEMSRKQYEIEPYYEFTSIINSLVGLLVFPEQNAFNYLSKQEILATIFPTLNKYVTDSDFINTYCGDKGRNTPYAIILHMKNALSHNRVMIFPENVHFDGKDQIESIVFQDAILQTRVYDRNQNRYRSSNSSNLDNYYGDVRNYVLQQNESIQIFSIKISVNDLEKCIMEIAKYLISIA